MTYTHITKIMSIQKIDGFVEVETLHNNLKGKYLIPEAVYQDVAGKLFVGKEIPMICESTNNKVKITFDL